MNSKIKRAVGVLLVLCVVLSVACLGVWVYFTVRQENANTMKGETVTFERLSQRQLDMIVQEFGLPITQADQIELCTFEIPGQGSDTRMFLMMKPDAAEMEAWLSDHAEYVTDYCAAGSQGTHADVPPNYPYEAFALSRVLLDFQGGGLVYRLADGEHYLFEAGYIGAWAHSVMDAA